MSVHNNFSQLGKRGRKCGKTHNCFQNYTPFHTYFPKSHQSDPHSGDSEGHSWSFPMKPGLPLWTKVVFCKNVSCGEEHGGLHCFWENFLFAHSEKWYSVPKQLHAKFTAKVILELSKQGRKGNTCPQNVLIMEIYVLALNNLRDA